MNTNNRQKSIDDLTKEVQDLKDEIEILNIQLSQLNETINFSQYNNMEYRVNQMDYAGPDMNQANNIEVDRTQAIENKDGLTQTDSKEVKLESKTASYEPEAHNFITRSERHKRQRFYMRNKLSKEANKSSFFNRLKSTLSGFTRKTNARVKKIMNNKLFAGVAGLATAGHQAVKPAVRTTRNITQSGIKRVRDFNELVKLKTERSLKSENLRRRGKGMTYAVHYVSAAKESVYEKAQLKTSNFQQKAGEAFYKLSNRLKGTKVVRHLKSVGEAYKSKTEEFAKRRESAKEVLNEASVNKSG